MCCGAKTDDHVPGVLVQCPDDVIKYATPDAEVVARARGVNLCNVTPTGMNGKMITRQDVLRTLGRGV